MILFDELIQVIWPLDMLRAFPMIVVMTWHDPPAREDCASPMVSTNMQTISCTVDLKHSGRALAFASILEDSGG